MPINETNVRKVLISRFSFLLDGGPEEEIENLLTDVETGLRLAVLLDMIEDLNLLPKLKENTHIINNELNPKPKETP